MIYFLLAFVWLGGVFIGLVMCLFRPLRRFGVMLMLSATFGFFFSFALSTLSFFLFGALAAYWNVPGRGIVTMLTYLLGALVGGGVGVLVGAATGWRLTRPRHRAMADIQRETNDGPRP